MISAQLITLVSDYVYKDIDKYGAPSKFQVDFANEKGQWLAEKLKADKNLVLLGTLLMDCKLGQAFKEGRLKDHVEMSYQKAEEVLSANSQVTEKEKEIILGCVKQHHGSEKFLSLEAEICCNADCYRFASVKGVIGGMKNLRDMPMDDAVKLFLEKADEKWKALSLDICKKELEPEYRAIKTFLNSYRSLGS
jgi:hypothetical protein